MVERRTDQSLPDPEVAADLKVRLYNGLHVLQKYYRGLAPPTAIVLKLQRTFQEAQRIDGDDCDADAHVRPEAPEGVNWITAVAMIGFHIGAVAALFYIDLGAMLTAVVLWIMAGSFGIGMGYHRLLTHRGYKTPSLG